MNKLRLVLLIDDNPADNFLHEMLLMDIGVAEQVDAVSNGQEALDYIKACAGPQQLPELICVDINMPVMDGWEFLDAYDRLPEQQKSGVVVMMISTTLNPSDMAAAEQRDSIAKFVRKPLTEESMRELLDTHFPGRFSS